MNELSLFTGIGGGLLGTKLLGWKSIGYVEINQYCQRVLQQRIKDGILDDAPIFGDIREFNRTFAEEFKGVVDVITAGFPCQPFSVAGKRQGADDERNMWPATIECICTVRPRYALLENVPGLLTSGYFGTILRDLAESGYDIRRCCLSAAGIGANHTRERLWLLAISKGNRFNSSNKKGISQGQILENKIKPTDRRSGNFSRSDNGNLWFEDEYNILRMDDDDAHRVDRLKAIGNAQVPAVVRAVWELLNE